MAVKKPSGNHGELDLGSPSLVSPSGQANGEDERARRQEFFLPVTGFVWFYPEEVAIIDHPAFQRLSRIHQLGQAHLVYRGATHQRIEHCLGAVHVVQRMADAVKDNVRKAKYKKLPHAPALTENELRFVRLGALLHDIGHLAAGHTIEDELGLLGKHDADDRITLIFAKAFKNDEGQTLSDLIDEQYRKFIPPDLATAKIPASVIVRVLIRKEPKPDADDFAQASETLKDSDELRWNVCSSMIGNTICADLLDYLHRDWHHIGKPRPFDERILQYMEIRPKNGKSGDEKRSRHDCFVISLGRRPEIRTDAISAVLELLEWRYQLAESVLFHRTKLSAAAMLDRAMFDLWKDEEPYKIEAELLGVGDDELLHLCAQLSVQKKRPIASDLFKKLTTRQLFDDLKTVSADQLTAEDRKRIGAHYGEGDDTNSRRVCAKNRNFALRLLEGDFQLPKGSLAMYCPTDTMNAKIAKVQIAFGDHIQPFDDYERAFDNQLSGGHLAAQLKRFKNLWRVHFFIDSKVKASMPEDELHLLIQAAEKLVLRLTDADPDTVARTLARQLIALKDPENSEYEVQQEAFVGAFKDEEESGGFYPLGMESIRRYARKK